MSDQNSVVALYNSHAEAEQALEKLKAASFDLKKVSVVGKDFRSEEKMVGYYTTGDHMKVLGCHGRLLGRYLGITLWSWFFSDSRSRSRFSCWPISRRHSGRIGIGRNSRRSLRPRCWPRQFGYPERQRPQIRGLHESRQVPAACEWHTRGSRKSTKILAETSPITLDARNGSVRFCDTGEVRLLTILHCSTSE
jgi:hypothetical protein